jgi:enediyne biosynthesis protein E5
MTATINKPPTAKVTAVAPPPPIEFKRDPRYLALRNFAISISIFSIFGYTILGFEQPWLWPFLALATGYSTEVLMEVVQAWFERRTPRFLVGSLRERMAFFLPSHITSLAVNMLLYANSRLWPVLFGVVVAVSQKAILQAPIKGRMRHFMNPSNLGITTTLVLFNWVSISPPYMFTEHVGDYFRLGIPMLIITAGTVINATLTKRIPLIVGFLGGFVIQVLIRWWLWDVAFYSGIAVMSGVALVLFTNYMITDPGTSPSKTIPQFMFGASVALVYGVLMVFNVVYTLFFATTIVCGARGLGWWGAHFYQKYQKRSRDAAVTQTGPSTQAVAA